MLEKIGLPAKPSMRGSNWVIDASHCQGCSSQFTLLNRKHHCRRCGGLFCNSCTQQRMILRGQGDSPVRICDPCKNLEEAARFEMRYGHKNRAGKGGPKLMQRHKDDVLNEILGSDGQHPFSSARETSTERLPDLQRAGSSASCSNLDGETVVRGKKGDTSLNISMDIYDHAINEKGSNSPEELRQQALEEKKKYRILKGEGKSDEALQAFKRGKELERQAGALELALRKSRKNASSLASTQKTNDDHHESGRKNKLLSQSAKEEKDDLTAELRELGWSDADMHGSVKKSVIITLEGELSSLLGDNPKIPSLGNGTSNIDKTQVLALKKKALMFKREGKLSEAKEELKRAKVLEKQLEEQELLADADESDDELSALVRNMDDYDDNYNGNQDDLSLNFMKGPGFDMADLAGVANDAAYDDNFEVTDADMNDPVIAVALKSFGWNEDANHLDDTVSKSVPMDAETLRREVQSLKRGALKLKQEGNVTQAMEQLKKAKLLEQNLENLRSDGHSTNTQSSNVGSNSIQRTSNLQIDHTDDEIITTTKPLKKSPPKSKLVIQRELLSVKKKALALRREGKMDEAEEELKKGKVLEQQLEELESASKPMVSKSSLDRKDLEPFQKHEDVTEEDTDVTEQDMHDPALLSILKNLGWEDGEVETGSERRKSSIEINSPSEHTTDMRNKPEIHDHRPKSKAAIQKELLSIKRKALALRRQGKLDEAEEELRMAKVLEAQMAEMEAASQVQSCDASITQERYESVGVMLTIGKVSDSIGLNDDVMMDVSESAKAVQDMDWKESASVQPPFATSSISASETLRPNKEMSESVAKHSDVVPPSNEHVNAMDLLTGNDENYGHFVIQKPANSGNSDTRISKRKMGAEDEISYANAPGHMAEKREKAKKTPHNDVSSAPESDPQSDHSSRQQEVLTHKRKAVALKREGKLTEAREELRQAKLLEKSLEAAAHHADAGNMNASGFISNDNIVAPEHSRNQAPKPISSRDRFKLQQESLGHKRQALKLRREGRIEESEAEFELAKAIETRLEELGSSDPYHIKSKNKVEADNGVGVEDLLDPQLLSALKAIGWQDVDIVEQQAPQQPEAQLNVVRNESQEKGQLEERIKAEKVQALNLKRAGRQAEALEALRRAKQLEKKLNSMVS
ncbi:FYVE zinc finger [Cinnamomum micranthum f. kanehirae]|uniref:FYVE zinc finger n=1 Tax=Cinnamomum micranthum f. kanehirae TaxID=337451 RepID=A0A3S3N6X3_9MAGN|nr:FYVE zinc finger [Cinnamomum micranthum f. kanehirae]